LRNRLGIIDEATLEEAEANIVATRSYELAQTPIPSRFDLEHLRAIRGYFLRAGLEEKWHELEHAL
jgi:fido (protein-threonine AMPylation protein)